MKELLTLGAYMLLALAIFGSAYFIMSYYRGMGNHTQLADALNTLQGSRETMKSSTLAVEVKDEVIGGVYKVQRAQASTALNAFKFEDDFTGDLEGKATGKDKLEVKASGTNAVAGEGIFISDTDNSFKGADTVAFDRLLCGNPAIPAIVPKDDTVKKNLVLSLLSVKDSSVEKSVVDTGKIGDATIDEFLNIVFDGAPVDDADLTKGFKGLVGLQLISPKLMEQSKIKIGKFKGYNFFEVCEVKSMDEIKTALMGDKIKLAEPQALDIAKGIKNLTEGDMVAIPQTVKNMIKDTDGIGVFSSCGRLKRY